MELNKSEERNWAAARALGVAAVGILAGLTFHQSGNYRDAETLYHATIASNPQCWLALNNLGNILYEKDQIDEALLLYRATLKFKPDHPQASGVVQVPRPLTDSTGHAKPAMKLI